MSAIQQKNENKAPLLETSTSMQIEYTTEESTYYSTKETTKKRKTRDSEDTSSTTLTSLQENVGTSRNSSLPPPVHNTTTLTKSGTKQNTALGNTTTDIPTPDDLTPQTETDMETELGNTTTNTPTSDDPTPQTETNMETDSVATIEDTPTRIKSYSQAVTGTNKNFKEPNLNLINQIQTWVNITRAGLAESKQRSFDLDTWTPDKIINAFSSTEELRKLINHKINSKPTQKEILPSIEIKFFYRDRAFFCTFTNRQEARPKHQKEFQYMLNTAIERYKNAHNALIINKNNREQVTSMLKKKIAIDYGTNLELSKLNAHEITQYILYITSFTQIPLQLKYEKLKELIAQIQTENLINLPNTPEEIDEKIKEILPFKLPIEDRRNIRAVLASLRQIYIFSRLPDAYINDKHIPLPANPNLLNSNTKKFFPITSRKDLKNLKTYKEELKKFYYFSTIPPSYFDLPPPKQPLPSTPQELRPRLREIFPFFPKDEEDFKTHIRLLREDYFFQTLPNDYIISKKKLPLDPTQLKLKTLFTYPIQDKQTALDFIEEIPHYFKIPDPLPLEYVSINYTNKLDLPTDLEKITEVNLTLPISTSKELIIAVRALREHYFFHKIPTKWIQIENKDSKRNKDSNRLPGTPEELNKILKEKKPSSEITFPITDPNEIP